MSPDELLVLFRNVGRSVREAVGALGPQERRARTDRPGQYHLDLVADDRALELLGDAPVTVVSEESGRSGDPEAPVTVVIDPVDGSTNCSRGIAYWATSLCALDRDGPVAALVVNQATGSEVVAIRGGGARRDGRELRAALTVRVEDAVIALSGSPAQALPWRQYRVLGCASLTLCEVAAGGIDGYVDGGAWHAPWDYLGAYLACREAGAAVVAADGAPLVTTEPTERRQILAAATPALLEVLRPAAVGSGAR